MNHFRLYVLHWRARNWGYYTFRTENEARDFMVGLLGETQRAYIIAKDNEPLEALIQGTNAEVNFNRIGWPEELLQ